MKPWQQAYLRAIPPVNDILATAAAIDLLRRFARERVVAAVSAVLTDLRSQVREAEAETDLAGIEWSAEAIAEAAGFHLERSLRPRLRPVVNGTGVILHTNLGRAPLAPAAVDHVALIASGYSNLELDLATGERGSRYAHVEELLCALTGAEAALVVNNNAAAVLLMLSALCKDREVIVSRGELVEIGGAFRVPDVMVQGGARLIEVGTTNKTHPRDYANAIGPETGAVLKVHKSNFKILGFTEEVEVAELAAIAHAKEVPCLVDWGSGVFVDLEQFGLPHEATMAELIEAGADLVTFSGDKLLGSAQGGFLVGKKALIDRCKKHPLTRALRVDKLTLAAIEATLRLYLDPGLAIREIPILRMMAKTLEEIEVAAERIAIKLEAAGVDCSVVDGLSTIGGGSLPGEVLPTKLVAIEHGAPHQVERRLRESEPPVLCRVSGGQLLIDPRTLAVEEEELVVLLLAKAIG